MAEQQKVGIISWSLATFDMVLCFIFTLTHAKPQHSSFTYSWRYHQWTNHQAAYKLKKIPE